jgi:hypothetical protein
LKQLSSLLKIPVSALIISLSLAATAGDPFRPSAGAGEAGMGYACIVNKGFWSSFHNQALLSYNNSLSAGFSYENRFGISQLATRTAALIVPAGKACLSGFYSHFGYTDYNRNILGAGCGLRLSEKIFSGVQIDYLSERTSGEYSNSSSLTFEAGLLVLISENTRIGVHVFNPIPNSIREKKLSSCLRVGAGTTFNELLSATVEAELSSGNSIILKTGFEYEAFRKVWLRGGFSTENTSFSFGAGFLTKFAKVDIGFLTHEQLGITSEVSVVFKIK